MTTVVRVGPLGLVLSLLWLMTGCSNRNAGAQIAPPEPEVSADLEPFLESYFSTWSRGDMEGYQGHFHDQAMIYLVRGGRVAAAVPLDPFIEGQSAAQSDLQRGVERMTSFRALEDRQAASVAVEWELVDGDERTVGVDRFTLIRDEQWRWKILALVYYSTDRGRVRTTEGD